MKITWGKYILHHYQVKDNGIFPNNNFLDVLLYKGVLNLPYFFSSMQVKKIFKKNNWSNAWTDGVFTFHHYHSITHEVMGVYKGKTTLMLGGEKGIKIKIEKGDVLLIPAGVAHKNLENQNQIKCVGAYPEGKDYDMNYGEIGERKKTDENIKRVPLPKKDPVFGLKGEMQHYWKKHTK